MEWDETHTINTEHRYCYCGQDRNLLDITLQCRKCRNWFHGKCTSVRHLPDLLFTVNYAFACRDCGDGEESFERTQAGWKDICTTSLANLILEDIVRQIGMDRRELFESKNAFLMENWHPEQYYYNKKAIIPYVDEHWASLCTERARTSTWWATLGSCLYTSKDIFVSHDEVQRSASFDFCLVDANLWHIRPVQATPKITKTTKAAAAGSTGKDKRKDTIGLHESRSLANAATEVAGTAVGAATAGAATATTPGPASAWSGSLTRDFSSTTATDHPCNRFQYKYIPCKPSMLVHVGYQQAESNPAKCIISVSDKSPYVSIAKDGLTVTTDKGFRMCRANVGVKHGNWYWEVTVRTSAGPASAGPHVRVGWARREACLNAPVGYDAYGYGYRDKTGEKLFCSRPAPYGEPYEQGDVIGLYISLPGSRWPFKSPIRKRIPIKYKDHFWFEEKDYRPSKEMQAFRDKDRLIDAPYEPRILKGSYITMYKNGVCQGEMFSDLFDFEDFGRLPETILARQGKKRRKAKKDHDASGSDDNFAPLPQQQWTEDPPLEDDGTLGYFPAVSVYEGGVVTCNFGPEFKYPPTDAEPWRPMCERYDEYMTEECMWDLVDEVVSSTR